MQHWFDSAIVQTGRLPLFILLVAFLAAFLFIRLSVRMIRAEVRWWPGNIQPGGLHVHHVIFGLVAMLISGLGMITLANYSTPVANAVLAGLFGIGAALVLDEFALVLYLDDVYWLERGRASIDAIFVAVAVMGLFVIGYRPLGFDGTLDELLNDQDLATLIATAILLAALAGLAVITFLKGKLWTGMLGLFLPPLLLVGAWRLGRPGAPWARWFYGTRPMKQSRAASREERYRQPVVRAKIAVQEAVSGRFGEPLVSPASPAEVRTAAPEVPAPAARRVQGAGERLANAIRWRRTRRRLRRAPLWRLPMVLVSVSVLLALAMTTFDGELVDENGQILSGMDTGSTATLLSVIAGGMITLAGLVFTALTLAMQFGASQLSIRVVPLLQQSPIMRWSIGMFLATFTFALITAFDLATTTEAVPLFSTVIALMMAVVSTLVLIGLVTQVSNVLNPGKLLGQIADSGRVAVHRMFPSDAAAVPVLPAGPVLADGPTRVIALRNTSPDGRVLLVVNSIRITRLARRWGVSIVVEPAVGDFVSVGSPLFTVRGPQQRVRPALLRRNLVFGESHSPDVSPAAAIQSIVDIALKALSPAINDPSRAVQAIDFLEDLLMLLASKAPATTIDEVGEVRTRVFVWESYVAMAVDEIRNFSPDSLMVQRRLRALLVNLLAVCSEDHRAPVEERLVALNDMAARRWHSDLDTRLSQTPDMQGFGRSAGLDPEID
ncbi:DUF2254 domain-containing protein [Tomitella biformata]|uniref:DUF2254 domain-containing protein n=1 Tax=Tomitella biformata TaxID=630403 RepID=UPI0004650BB8|nr:DUF2254 family protein [Tomitella biformata]